MTRLLGIDPGSRITGYGIIEVDGRVSKYVDSGCIRTQSEDLPGRLQEIFAGISEIMAAYEPAEMAIEKVFMHRNADSALKLGQARGAAICACSNRSISISEYSPREIKQAVVGSGAASKDQVQHMVCSILSLNSTPQEDAADALAIALTHMHMSQGLASMSGVSGKRRGRLR